MNMSKHARTRAQQRAIPQMVVDLLLQFGRSEPAGDGTHKLFIDKSGRRRIKAYAGAMAGVLDAHLNVYAVISGDQQVVTVAHRLERIKRD